MAATHPRPYVDVCYIYGAILKGRDTPLWRSYRRSGIFRVKKLSYDSDIEHLLDLQNLISVYFSWHNGTISALTVDHTTSRIVRL